MFRHAAQFAFLLIASAAFFALAVVVSNGSKFQVIRSYTSRNVAFVKNVKAVWNASVFLQPHHAMSVSHASLVTESSMPKMACTSSPQPTISQMRNTRRNRTISVDAYPKSNGGGVVRFFPPVVPTPTESTGAKFSTTGTTASNTISRIFEFCLANEMVDVDAARNVAEMPNNVPFWNWSAQSFPDENVSANGIRSIKHPVSVPIFPASPDVTIAGFSVHVLPKALLEYRRLCLGRNDERRLVRHNGHIVVFSGTQSVTGRLSAATLSETPVNTS